MNVHKILIYVALGWLTFTGSMHFLIDVLSQSLRHKRAPGPETTLYYGLNTAYALSQVLFGVFGLLVARQALGMWSQWPVIAIGLAATAAWLTFTFLFIAYREPKIAASVFAVLFLASVLTGLRT